MFKAAKNLLKKYFKAHNTFLLKKSFIMSTQSLTQPKKNPKFSKNSKITKIKIYFLAVYNVLKEMFVVNVKTVATSQHSITCLPYFMVCVFVLSIHVGTCKEETHHTAHSSE